MKYNSSEKPIAILQYYQKIKQWDKGTQTFQARITLLAVFFPPPACQHLIGRNVDKSQTYFFLFPQS